MQVTIVILNFRTPELTLGCLESVVPELAGSRVSGRVVVVDNASGDDSVERFHAAMEARGWCSCVDLVEAPANDGFSAGHDLGVRSAPADAYLLLNSDTLLRPGALRAMLACLENDPAAGIVAPRLEDPDGTVQVSRFRYHTPLSETIAAARTGPVTRILRRFEIPIPIDDQSSAPDWVSFAAVLIRDGTYGPVGGMDTGYFMYYEDADFCRRATRAGWKIRYAPEARVVHLRGGSSPVKRRMAARERPPAYLYASRTRYYRKFYGLLGPTAANLCWLAGRLISACRETLGSKDPHLCEREALDIWTHWTRPRTVYRPLPPGRGRNTCDGDRTAGAEPRP